MARLNRDEGNGLQTLRSIAGIVCSNVRHFGRYVELIIPTTPQRGKVNINWLPLSRGRAE
jgi:hypothetical protein